MKELFRITDAELIDLASVIIQDFNFYQNAYVNRNIAGKISIKDFTYGGQCCKEEIHIYYNEWRTIRKIEIDTEDGRLEIMPSTYKRVQDRLTEMGFDEILRPDNPKLQHS